MEKKPVAVVHDDSLPEVAQAANIALIILGRTGTASWAELTSRPEVCARVTLTARQQELLERYRAILATIRRKPKITTVSACPVCGMFVFTVSSLAGRCALTSGCPGRMVNAVSTAPRAKKTAPAPADTQEPDTQETPVSDTTEQGTTEHDTTEQDTTASAPVAEPAREAAPQ